MVCGREAQYSEKIVKSASQVVPPKFCGSAIVMLITLTAMYVLYNSMLL